MEDLTGPFAEARALLNSIGAGLDELARLDLDGTPGDSGRQELAGEAVRLGDRLRTWVARVSRGGPVIRRNG